MRPVKHRGAVQNTPGAHLLRPIISAALLLGLAKTPTIAGGCSRAPRALPVAVEVARPIDRAIIEGNGDRAVVTIASGNGIGSARIARVGRIWPGVIEIGLRYADGRPFLRLESARIETDRCSWITFLGNADTVTCTGTGDTPAQGLKAAIPVRLGDRFLSVEIPTRSLAAACDTLRVSWIDVYRH